MAAFILGVGLLGTITLPAHAQAIAPVRLDKIEVNLWPEYDRAEMLVINHIYIAADVTLPAPVTLRIPAAAGDPANLAYRASDGQLYNLTYTRQASGEWSDVAFSTPTNEIQLEYYDPGLSKDGAKRSYIYSWPGSYAIKTVQVQVQQPTGATDMKLSPQAGSPIPGAGGLAYFTANLPAVIAGQGFTYQVNYQKANDLLSVQNGKVVPAAPITANTPGRATLSSIWWILLGVLALLLIAGGIWWYWRATRLASAEPVRRRHLPSRERISEPTGVDSVYCYHCGKRAAPGDVFCRSCGKRLRREET
jgi:hypothetical protein